MVLRKLLPILMDEGIKRKREFGRVLPQCQINQKKSENEKSEND